MTVISGRQEAEWVYQGVTSNPALAGLRLLIMDVGGGSTEFILSSGGQARACHSHPLGAVRMLELLHPADPPSPEDHARCRRMLSEFIVQRVAPDMHPGLAEDTAPIHLVGTGGSATILARMEGMLDSFDRDGVESARLSRARVTWWMNHLWSLPLAGRRRIVGLPKKRADVILTGGSIYEAVMDAFGISEMRVSTRGLRYAAVMAEAMPEGA
jgi:exopolyphosphatase/guanosine-5'-triphosphate,3'-diphosphate pyrophosphatase